MSDPSGEAEQEATARSFAGAGKWLGAAEVYDGRGRFKGNGQDTRHVQLDVEPGVTEVEVSFVGPFKMSGTYRIADRGDHRLYQGPVNVGFAETLGDGLIDANAYWADPGLSQRFFLMVLPGGERQLSLALMSRGEHLLYVVVGEYHRQPEGDADRATGGLPAFVAGTEHDLADDPSGGRGSVLLHRPGRWSGELRLLDDSLAGTGTTKVSEEVRPGADGRLDVETRGNGFSGDAVVSYRTDQIDAWSTSGDVVGSYSLSGGRALVGTIVHHTEETRCWRREVVAHDGSHKAVVHTWYRGGRRIGVAHGVLDFEPGVVTDAFVGDWRVTEYVHDPGGEFVGRVHQERHLDRLDDGVIRVTQRCTPEESLREHPMGGFAGEWVFELTVDGDRRRYHGPDVIGGATEWAPGAMTGEGVWPRFGPDFDSYAVLATPRRQLTGGRFGVQARPAAAIVGVAVPEDDIGDGWPELDLDWWPTGEWIPDPQAGAEPGNGWRFDAGGFEITGTDDWRGTVDAATGKVVTSDGGAGVATRVGPSVRALWWTPTGERQEVLVVADALTDSVVAFETSSQDGQPSTTVSTLRLA